MELEEIRAANEKLVCDLGDSEGSKRGFEQKWKAACGELKEKEEFFKGVDKTMVLQLTERNKELAQSILRSMDVRCD